MPTFHVHSGRRSDQRAGLQDVDRRSASVPPLEDGPCISRAEVAESGTSIDIQAHISRAGDGDVRHPLYEAANSMLARYRGFCSLNAWGLKIAKRRGHKRACVAVACELTVIMHAMWRDGSEFRFKEPKAQASGSTTATPKLIGVAAQRTNDGACHAAQRRLGSQGIRVSGDGSDPGQGRREARYLVCGAGDRDHARMSVDEAPRSRCGHVPRHGNGAGEHGGVHGASELRVRYGLRWPIQLWRRHARVLAGLCMLKRWRSSWPANGDQVAQLGGQDKAN